MLSAETFSNTRIIMFGLTGLACLLYAIMALLTGNPEPFSAWIPGGLGVMSGVVLWATGAAVGDANTERAMDESYYADSGRAQQIAFWVAIFMYPAFSVPLSLDLIELPVVFASMGTLTGATFLLLFVWFDLRGRM
ncbi:hypothetical protein [Cognatishimia sp. MH4019]|uniref:hypothetical protein n=1 Tax=Cognatishimia sp. MH4019 TaxID=2854030 RepID=UPI001CD7FAD8|nr:hypothetical protein [Cognatishimia sp. MH4019]